MEQPDHLAPYRELAADWLQAGCVTDFIFSGPTYQIQVVDQEQDESYWVFLQLQEDQSIQDAFCSCDIADDLGGCPHLTCAFLFATDGIPLHKRFERSFWHALAHQMQDQPFPQALTMEGLDEPIQQIIQGHQEQDEESSLKFSNLSEELIDEWREGSPSPELAFELSIWADFAKWGYKQQLLHPPVKIEFEKEFRVHLGDAVIHWTPIDWDEVIPTLPELGFKERVFGASSGEPIGLHYTPNTGYLNLEVPQSTAPSPANGQVYGSWLYVPGKGFYPKDGQAELTQKVISQEQIPTFLERYGQELAGQTTGVQIEARPVELQGQMFFDEEWNLHVETYLKRPKDLGVNGFLMHGWVYQDQGDGAFLKVARAPFEQLEMVIPKAKVSEFVTAHRSWLATQPSFRTHLSAMETQLSYEVDDHGTLRFFAETAQEDQPIDFGRWLYVPGEGFYSPRQRQFTSSLYPGLEIESVDLPRFIQLHRDELEGLDGFFVDKSPVRSVGLHVQLDEREWIVVDPLVESDLPLQVFYPYVYAEEKGFYELPSDHRVPADYAEQVSIDPGQMGSFLTEDLPNLSRYVTKMDPELQIAKQLNFVVEAADLTDGVLLSCHYASELGSASVIDLWERARSGEKFAFTPAGLIDLHQGRFGWLRYLKEAQVSEEQVQLTTVELLRLHAFEDLEGSIPELEGLLQSESKGFIPSTKGLESELRPYQEVGLHWLCYLYEYGLSGLLCDDMGLGKTHQAMALIAAILNRKKELKERRKYRFLVVCPTSVIYHWQDKLEQFLPSIKVRTYYGQNRTLKIGGAPFDLILTSYGVLRRDRVKLQKMDFELTIYDEIQIAKNHESHIHSALSSVNARMRLGLTGTPIENRLRELKAIIDLILPGYMPSEGRFKHEFTIPIEKMGDDGKKALLSRFVHPFILRRKKEEVLTDLPDKVEEIARCPLLADQKGLYQEVLSQGKQELSEKLSDEGLPVPYMHVFAILTRLKQICDHPAVYHKDVENYKNYNSGKWNLFVELLEEARNSGQKVVVFTQYLRMMDILEAYLKEHGIGYASIRGATANRGEQIKRFHSDPDCEVFVGSLQAAGVGIDLTAGSVVVHYDRWWNAAKENQATDRVHRIGQHRGVQVFKMVTEQTFEERIHAMIEQKGKLMEELIGTDDQGLIKLLSREELMQLFQDLSE